jgi:hypothetical protein
MSATLTVRGASREACLKLTHDVVDRWGRLTRRQRRQTSWVRHHAEWQRSALAALIVGVALPDAIVDVLGLETEPALDQALGRARWNRASWGDPWPAPGQRQALARLLVAEGAVMTR